MHDVAHHGAGVAAVGVDPHGGDLPVQRHPVGHQRPESLLGVTGEQRPPCAAGGAPNALGHTDFQVDHGVAGQCLAHVGGGHRAAAERHHAVVLGQGRAHHVGLDAAELGFALDEDLGDGAAGALDDLGVGVEQRYVQRLGQATSDRGLARAGHAHQDGLGRHQPDACSASCVVCLGSVGLL